MATGIPEKDIFKPRDPAITNENDWPEFNLKNVTITNKEGLLISLLTADEGNPLTVIGTLDAVFGRARESLLPNAKYKWQLIRLSNVFRYSYGAYANGKIQLWAEGAAGWFAIKPAESYRDIFSEMIEAVSLWYFILDTYTERKKISADKLIEQYAEANKLKPTKAQDILYRHVDFVVAQMQKGEGGVIWSNTSIYKRLQRQRPSTKNPTPQQGHGKAKRSATSAASESESRPSSIRAQSPRSVHSEAEQNTTPLRTTRIRNKEARYQTIEEQTRKDYDKSRVNALWRFMQKISEEKGLTQPDLLCLEAFAYHVHRNFVFATENEAANYIRFYAADLVTRMQHRDRTAIPWAASRIYSELLVTKLAPIVRIKMAKLSMRRRDEPMDDVEDMELLAEDTDSSEEQIIVSPAKAGKRHHTRGGLRMATGKGPGKGKGKITSNTTYSTVLDTERDDDAVSVGSKRRAIAAEDRPRKRSRRQIDPTESLSPDTQDDEEDQSDQTMSSEVEGDEFGRSKRKRRAHSIGSDSFNSFNPDDIEITAAFHTDQASEPNQPGDIWSCEHIGCNHVVYGGSHMLGQALIQEHLDEHNDTIKYVLGEKGLTNLPVGNLIKRIREMADDSSAFPLGSPDTSQIFPSPIAHAL